VDATIDSDSIRSAVASTNVIWKFGDRYLFVSPGLRARLALEFPSARFSEGFSEFYGV
jgi:hypothetical protein